MRFYEDIEIGAIVTSPPFTLERDELVRFAQRWDPLPIHIDDDVTNGLFGAGGVTAPGVLLLAISTRLLHQLPGTDFRAVIAAVGVDETRFHAPVHAGDSVRLQQEWISKRVSSSTPDRAVATCQHSLINQHDEMVLSHLNTALVRVRGDGTPS